MKYKMKGGGVVEGNSAKEVAESLRKMSFTPGKSLKAFMNQTSAACQLQTGAIISTYNEEEFITDLVHNEFLEEFTPEELAE